jgi:hypothetical protein
MDYCPKAWLLNCQVTLATPPKTPANPNSKQWPIAARKTTLASSAILCVQND